MAKKNLHLTDAIDENLKLVRDEDGTDTPLELSTKGAKITGDLDVTGSYKGPVTVVGGVIKSDHNMIIDSAGDITLDVGDDLTINTDDMTVNVDTLKFTNDTTLLPKIEIINTRDDANDCSLYFIKNRNGDGSDGQADDFLGRINWYAFNDAGLSSAISYAQIRVQQLDASSTNERGLLEMGIRTNAPTVGSSIITGLKLTGSTTDDEVDVDIGAGTASVTTIAGILDIDGDKITNNTVAGFTIDAASAIILDSGVGQFRFYDAGDADDSFKITVAGGTGVTTLETVSDGDDGHLILDADGDLTLDSNSGNFIAKKAGTEFSVANSAYAGMILGYTTDGIDILAAYETLGTAMEVTDNDHNVSFKAPPSGVVEIFVSIYGDFARRTTIFGLSDLDQDTGYSPIDFPNSNDTTNEHVVSVPPSASGDRQINHTWVVTGLTPGTTYKWWLGAMNVSISGTVLRWGGNGTAQWSPFIMKATALPTAVTDFAVYG